MLKTGLKNIAAEVEVDQSKINQIGDASVVFGEREERRDAGHVQSHRRRSLEFSGRGSLGELLHVWILSHCY
ncbi:hypothetical protein Q8A67_021338 [Cirrhinus molitorella]|uniref:Uncharacterized protein n=1 Tax=Cirrhinus molitorella TaxID=172907 RepID=A0AA88P3D2_9TELE|nr:hypothetical protein Q8A67_021338 [Cirrhinus molitorella]